MNKIVKIGRKKYRLMPEADYLALLNDLQDLGKILKYRAELGMEARAFFKEADKKFDHQ